MSSPAVWSPTSAAWNAGTGQAWVELQGLLDRISQPVGEAVEAAAFPGPGGRVLDVGCGAGTTTLSMAARLGPGGLCLGVDVSAPLLAVAHAQAASLSAPSAEFVEADAQTWPFPDASFDAVMSRFGVMFFADPVAAFTNLRRATRSDGRLVFASWRSPAENPMATLPVEAAADLLPPMPSPAPNAPGRFAFADAGYVREILEASGWRNIDIAPLDTQSVVTVEEAMLLSLKLGPLGNALAQQDEATRTRVADRVAAALEPHVRDGKIVMPAACWLVTAKA